MKCRNVRGLSSDAFTHVDVTMSGGVTTRVELHQDPVREPVRAGRLQKGEPGLTRAG